MKHLYHHNWRKETGFTLKQGKELCLKLHGKLPRCGRIMTICEVYQTETEVSYYKKLLEISNISGSYELSTYRSPNWHNQYYYANMLPDNAILVVNGKAVLPE